MNLCKRRPFQLPILLILALSGLGYGCDSSSPTNPGQFPITAEGMLERGGADELILPLSGEGVIRFTFEKLEIIQADPDATPPQVIAIGFRLGRNGTECLTSTDRTFIMGDSVLFSLAERDYCLEFYDSGFIPEGDMLAYTVFIELVD